MSQTPTPIPRSESLANAQPAQPAHDAAWRDEELRSSPHESAEKAGKVQRMFTAIADSYDLNNRVHSLGQDVRWRNFATRVAQVRRGEVVLDVACGTGDLAQAFARTEAARVLGVDFTHAMLVRAGEKRGRLPGAEGSKITYLEGDAQALPIADASVDVVSMAFGIRNVQDPARALRECARVLRPGGRLIILEFDRPRNPLVRWFNDVYCARVMPRTATLIARDKSGAYKYLPKSVATFLPRDQMAQLIERSGFARVRTWTLSMGLCVCYRALKG